MRAVVKFGESPGQVEVREVSAPELPADQVLVRTAAVGVCGSDIHMWHNKQSWRTELPVVLGHEMAGTIAGVGPDVSGWQVGDRVVCETAARICGQCALCRAGRYNLCPYREGYGATRDGSFTELLAVEPRILHRVPDHVRLLDAALTEPYAVAFNALVERAHISPGDLVVVQGVGAIGALSIQIARLRGADTVVALGTSTDAIRLQQALRHGADHAIDIGSQDAGALVSSLGDGLGADVVVDATGVSAALRQSLELVRPGGQIAKIGWGPDPLGFSLDPLVAKAVTLYGSFSHSWDTWERVLRLFASGKLQPSSVIGGTYPLDAWEEAFTEMEAGRNTKSVMTTGALSGDD
ncbi:MAG: zinc-binding dehydrogenase [Propionibacteriaceae bacterium]